MSEELVLRIKARLIELGFDPSHTIIKDDRIIIEDNISIPIDQLISCH